MDNNEIVMAFNAEGCLIPIGRNLSDEAISKLDASELGIKGTQVVFRREKLERPFIFMGCETTGRSCGNPGCCNLDHEHDLPADKSFSQYRKSLVKAKSTTK